MPQPPPNEPSNPAAALSRAATQAFDQLVQQCLTNFTSTLHRQLQVTTQLSQLPTPQPKGYRVFRTQGMRTLLASRSAPDTNGLEVVYPKATPEGESLENCLQFINQHTPAALPKSRDRRLESNELARELHHLENTMGHKPSSPSLNKPDEH